MTGVRYACTDCGETFPSAPAYGGHVHARHPERRRALPKFLQGSGVAPSKPRRSGALKRDTDHWPAKP